MSEGKIRVLVVSYLPWRNDVSVGNTLSNIFDGMQDKIEFSNIYFKGGTPLNNVAQNYYYIPEKELAKSILTRKSVGKKISLDNVSENHVTEKKGAYNKARQLRWELFLLAQDMIGILGKWHSKELDLFVEEIQPQLIFGPLGRVPASNILMSYLHDKYSIPVIAYAWDDHYSLHKQAVSPFFWGKTFLERKYIRKCAQRSEVLYTITEEMKKEYSQYFNKKCKVLYKAYDFNDAPEIKSKVEYPLTIIYMGNIGAGRWKELEKVAQAIKSINKNKKKCFLKIHTMSPHTDKIEKALNIDGASALLKPVLTADVLRTMRTADILLHVEPTGKKERNFFRLSFSTKIVDYLYNARCIVAVGGHTAAMSYLEKNNAAIVIEDENKIQEELEKLVDNPNKIEEYAYKSWECGRRNHQKNTIQDMIYSDFMQAVCKETYSRGNNENR